jgi:hypothetical protein
VKDQYFGDINDYRKYGLLRALTEASGLRLGVCWLLTAGDQRADGEFRRYLEQPERWRQRDPHLYDGLQRLRTASVERSVGHAGAWGLLPDARYLGDALGDRADERAAYFRRAWEALADCPLLFFDPDNGLETKGTRPGHKNSAKYLYWAEVEDAYWRGHSLVIYQHWPRVERQKFTQQLVATAASRLGAPLVDTFTTAHVLFLLIAQPEHRDGFRKAHELIRERWSGEITPQVHRE